MIVIEYFLNHTVYGNLNAELVLSIYATNSDAKKQQDLIYWHLQLKSDVDSVESLTLV